MSENWKFKTDSKGNIVFYNPKIVYRYEIFDDGFLNCKHNDLKLKTPSTT